jgi:hypothetical protein
MTMGRTIVRYTVGSASHRLRPGIRQPFGQRHEEAEEV